MSQLPRKLTKSLQGNCGKVSPVVPKGKYSQIQQSTLLYALTSLWINCVQIRDQFQGVTMDSKSYIKKDLKEWWCFLSYVSWVEIVCIWYSQLLDSKVLRRSSLQMETRFRQFMSSQISVSSRDYPPVIVGWLCPL